jgi:hypothetical protein
MLRRVGRRLRLGWDWYRQFAAALGLLKWLGWLGPMTSAVLSAWLSIESVVRGLPWTVSVVLGLVAFVAFLGIFVLLSLAYKTWRPTRNATPYQPRLTPPLPIELREGNFTAGRLAATGPAAPAPLSDSECRLEWSLSESSTSLRFFVWNGTSHSSPCSVRLRNTQRWSVEQGVFVDALSIRPYSFEVLRSIVAPENSGVTCELVKSNGDSFEILSTTRGRPQSGSKRGIWRMEFSVKLGTRERIQNLDFEWTDTGGLVPIVA